MLDDKQIQFLSENLPFYNSLSEIEKEEIIKGSELCTAKSNVIVHDDSKSCTGLLLIEKGVFRTYYISESGKEITLFRLFDRDVCVLTAPCILRNITFTVHVVTEVETTYIKINPNVYKKLSDTNAEVADFTSQLISSRFSDVMWVMEQVVFTSFDKRLALFLEEQSNILQSDEINVTHDFIARNLGTAREVVTRMLKYFSHDKIVSLSRGTIKIIDRKKLEALTK